MGDLEGPRLCFEAAEKLARASDRGDFNDTLARDVHFLQAFGYRSFLVGAAVLVEVRPHPLSQ